MTLREAVLKHRKEILGGLALIALLSGGIALNTKKYKELQQLRNANEFLQVLDSSATANGYAGSDGHLSDGELQRFLEDFMRAQNLYTVSENGVTYGGRVVENGKLVELVPLDELTKLLRQYKPVQ